MLCDLISSSRVVRTSSSSKNTMHQYRVHTQQREPTLITAALQQKTRQSTVLCATYSVYINDSLMQLLTRLLYSRC